MKIYSIFAIMIGVIGRFSGYSRDVAIIAIIGIGTLTDHYVLFMSIPLMLYGVFASSIQNTTIMLIKDNNDDYADYFASLIFVSAILVVLIYLALAIFNWPITKLLFPSLGAIGNKYYVIMLLGSAIIFLSCLINILTAVLVVRNRQIIIAISPLVLNIVFIMLIFSLKKHLSIIILFIINIISYAAQLGWTYASTQIRIGIVDKDKVIRIIKKALPIVLGSATEQVNTMIIQSSAARQRAGFVTDLNYSGKVTSLVTSTYAASVLTIVYSRILVANRKSRQAIVRYGSMTVGVSLIISAFIFYNSEIVSKLLFGYGKIGSIEISQLGAMIRIYALGIPAIMARDYLYRVCYSINRPKLPMGSSIISMISLIIAIIFMKGDQIILAYVLSMYIAAMFLAIQLIINRRLHIGQIEISLALFALPLSIVYIVILKIIAASGMMTFLSSLIIGIILILYTILTSLDSDSTP